MSFEVSWCNIGTRRAGQTGSSGSAFFVAAHIGYGDQVLVYAVTAKHCLFDAYGMPDEVLLSVNTTSGIGEIRTDPSEWIQHPTSDVAILHVLPDRSRFRYRVYPTTSAATEGIVADRAIGPGDDVFIVGLLVHHPGKNRIMPIVRLGNIAALPENSVRLRLGSHEGAQTVDEVVTLLEVRSIGGLSGSPVFVHLPFWRDLEEGGLLVGTGSKASSGGENWLLGVMHGFYPVGQNDPDGVSAGNEDLNTGIAVITRVDRLMDLINHPSQVLLRETLKKQFEERGMPKPVIVTDSET